MHWTSILAIYILFWVMCAFILLPFGVKTPDEVGAETIPGQAESAPVNFRPRRLTARATVMAAACTALYVANYINGWITAEDLNLFGKPPTIAEQVEAAN